MAHVDNPGLGRNPADRSAPAPALDFPFNPKTPPPRSGDPAMLRFVHPPHEA